MRSVGLRYALAMVDVDHFKSFNDKWGHAEGDNVLRRVARHLDLESGGTVYRYGGEEFAVYYPRQDVAGRRRSPRPHARASRDHPVQDTQGGRPRGERPRLFRPAPRSPVGQRHRSRSRSASGSPRRRARAAQPARRARARGPGPLPGQARGTRSRGAGLRGRPLRAAVCPRSLSGPAGSRGRREPQRRTTCRRRAGSAISRCLSGRPPRFTLTSRRSASPTVQRSLQQAAMRRGTEMRVVRAPLPLRCCE